MEQIVVNGIVATAVLFLLRGLFRNFLPKRTQKVEPSCGSCPQCASSAEAQKATNAAAVPVAVPVKK